MGSGATSGLMVTRSIRGIPVSTMKVPPARAPIWAPAMIRTRSRLTLTPASRCDRCDYTRRAGENILLLCLGFPGQRGGP
jgi:hypothetical protein